MPQSSTASLGIHEMSETLATTLTLFGKLFRPGYLTEVLHVPTGSGAIHATPPTVAPMPNTTKHVVALTPPPVPSVK